MWRNFWTHLLNRALRQEVDVLIVGIVVVLGGSQADLWKEKKKHAKVRFCWLNYVLGIIILFSCENYGAKPPMGV